MKELSIQTGKLSQSPDPQHHHRVILYALGAIFIMIIAGCIGYIFGTKTSQPTQSQTTPTQAIAPSPTIDSTTSWRSYLDPIIQFSFLYPTDWNVESISDLSIPNRAVVVGVNATGPQGTIHIAWGHAGLGGACPQGVGQIQIQGGTINTCHRINSDGSESYGNIYKQLTDVNFAANATINPPASTNRATVLQILSTFKFADQTQMVTPTCMPRPACLDSTPRCMIAEPANGWCTK